MIIFSHPTGNANVRAIADAMVEQHVLYQFHTSIASFPGNIWDRLGKFTLLEGFTRRKYNPQLQPYTILYPWMEIGRVVSTKIGWEFLHKHERGLFCVDQIYKSLDQRLSRHLMMDRKTEITAVYAYEDGALESFIRAKEMGLKCLYDLPIAYWETGRRLLKEEAERMPSWEGTLGGGTSDSEVKLERKQKELELADVIVGPGDFVMNSLPSWAKHKKKIIAPFGSPEIAIEKDLYNRKRIDKGPIRVLFVGSMGQRKGLGDLFEAMKLLNSPDLQLVVLGSPMAPMEFYRKQFSEFIFEPGRAHSQVLELMRSCDVFCLPSIVEGRALVMQEAMSQGLPLIITPNTGGEDLVQEGKTGFLVPIRSPEAIAAKLQWFIDNRNLIPEMSKNARNLSQNYTWASYGNRVVSDLKAYLDESTMAKN